MKIKIKICGINEAAFARRAEALGADYLGFIFAPESPRHVTVEEVRRAQNEVRGTARLVGVFAHEDVEEIERIASICNLDIIQLHRRATVGDVAALQGKGYEVWTLAGGAEGDGVLYDSSHGDGEKVFGARGDRALPITIVAGGISAANLGAYLRLGADVIDVSGSLETAPGVKSIAKLEAFFETFRKETGHVEDAQ